MAARAHPPPAPVPLGGLAPGPERGAASAPCVPYRRSEAPARFAGSRNPCRVRLRGFGDSPRFTRARPMPASDPVNQDCGWGRRARGGGCAPAPGLAPPFSGPYRGAVRSRAPDPDTGAGNRGRYRKTRKNVLPPSFSRTPILTAALNPPIIPPRPLPPIPTPRACRCAISTQAACYFHSPCLLITMCITC